MSVNPRVQTVEDPDKSCTYTIAITSNTPFNFVVLVKAYSNNKLLDLSIRPRLILVERGKGCARLNAKLRTMQGSLERTITITVRAISIGNICEGKVLIVSKGEVITRPPLLVIVAPVILIIVLIIIWRKGI